MSRVAPREFEFRRGIDKVVRAPSQRPSSVAVQALGAHGATRFDDVGPSQEPARARLDALYAQPNLDDLLREDLAPRIGQTALLRPQRFDAALVATLAGLREAAAADPRNARLLGRAARLLADQVALRELYRAYHGALLRG